MENKYDLSIDDEIMNSLSEEDELTAETFEELSNEKGDDEDE